MAAPYIPYDGPIVTRAEAIEAGLRRFFIGKPCEKRGHISERGLNGSCIACKRVYDAELYVKDGTAKRAASNKRRLENPEAIRAAKAAHYRENIELYRARTKAYNLQALCPSCNWSKGARCPISWAQSRGRLL